jgi:hypothetical protein
MLNTVPPAMRSFFAFDSSSWLNIPRPVERSWVKTVSCLKRAEYPQD